MILARGSAASAMVAFLAVITATLAGTANQAEAASGPATRGWRQPTASVNRDATDVVNDAPKGDPLTVVVTTESANGPEVESIRAGSAAEARRLVEAAQGDGDTLAVGMAQRMTATKADPYLGESWPVTTLGARTVWKTTLGRGVTVAVIGTGVDARHEDLRGRVLHGYDVQRDTAAGDVDQDGHDTGVAGIIAANLDNGLGAAGLAPAATILPIRVADDGSEISSGAVAEGIVWAADHGADVINMSLGGTGDDPSVGTAVEYAASRNIVVVASAGNEQLAGNPREYPAAYPDVVGVGAIDRNYRIADFSNTGDYVDVVAPGVDVLTTIPLRPSEPPDTPPYGYFSGTSASAPFVAAAAALAIERNGPGYSAKSVIQQILTSAQDLGPAGRDDTYGYGAIRPTTLVANGTCPPPTAAIRICGADRYATATALSKATFSPGLGVAYIASGTGFADALGGSLAAALGDAPLLLSARDGLANGTKAELSRLQPGRIVVLGGPASISSTVLGQLRSYTSGAVSRLAGDDRYETAAAIARAAFPNGARTALIASGENFPDALSGSPAAATVAGPLLLTRHGALPASITKVIADLGVSSFVVLGGSDAVSNSIVSELQSRGDVVRVQGENRYATSAAISKWFFPQGAASAFVASGAAFPDALAGSAVAGRIPAPVLLTAKLGITSFVLAELRRVNPDAVTILGGVDAISEIVRRQVEDR